MKKDNGGPAFPNIDSDERIGIYVGDKGMTLRDYFAGQAISLFPLTEANVAVLMRSSGGIYPQHDLVADFCYDLADAMLRKRFQG